jgi:hypothetical protein
LHLTLILVYQKMIIEERVDYLILMKLINKLKNLDYRSDYYLINYQWLNFINFINVINVINFINVIIFLTF